MTPSLQVDSRLLVINRLLQDFFEKSTFVGKSWKSTVRSTFETIVDSMVNFFEKSQLLQDLGSAT
jgi:hypothetical protein